MRLFVYRHLLQEIQTKLKALTDQHLRIAINEAFTYFQVNIEQYSLMSVYIAIGELLLDRPITLRAGRVEDEKEVFIRVCADVLDNCHLKQSQDFKAFAREWGLERTI